jgi:hypothetical protein
LTGSGDRRQRPGAPLSRSLRLGLCSQAHDLDRVNLALAPAARQILLDSLESTAGVPSPPTSRLNSSDAEHFANLMLSNPSAASSTMLARRAKRTSVVFECASFISWFRCASSSSIAFAFRIAASQIPRMHLRLGRW